jgi:hypothetical protein
MVAETGGGILFAEFNLAGAGHEKRELEFTDGTLPVVLMVLCRMAVR